MVNNGKPVKPVEFSTDKGTIVVYGWSDSFNEGISIWYRPNEENGKEIEIADVGEVKNVKNGTGDLRVQYMRGYDDDDALHDSWLDRKYLLKKIEFDYGIGEVFKNDCH